MLGERVAVSGHDESETNIYNRSANNSRQMMQNATYSLGISSLDFGPDLIRGDSIFFELPSLCPFWNARLVVLS